MYFIVGIEDNNAIKNIKLIEHVTESEREIIMKYCLCDKYTTNFSNIVVIGCITGNKYYIDKCYIRKINNNDLERIVIPICEKNILNHIEPQKFKFFNKYCGKDRYEEYCIKKSVNKMRNPTNKERESVDNYIKSISTSTEINFFDYI